MTSLEFTVGRADSGKRLDVFLVEAGVPLSRRKIRQVIDVGGIYVNRKRVRIASRQVAGGDLVRVEYSEAALTKLKAANVKLAPEDLLVETPELFAINKPPGLPSQATLDQSVQHVVPCLEALLKARADGVRYHLVLVHRLDKETSGVLLVAKSAASATWLTEQFRARKVKKIYVALCYGVAPRPEFTECSPLSEIDKRTGDVRIVRAGGRPAVTHVRVLAVNKELGISLVECRPETGRSHQLRVHLAHNDLPIIGDKRYGGARRRELPAALAELTAEHHLLHAHELTVVPGKDCQPLHLRAPLPPNFARFLERARMKL